MYPGRCDFGKHHSALQAPRFKDSASSNFTFQMDNDPWLAMSFFEIPTFKAYIPVHSPLFAKEREGPCCCEGQGEGAT